MKKKNALWLSVAAGTLAVAAIGYLIFSDRGRNWRHKKMKASKKLLSRLDEAVENRKKKFEQVKESLASAGS